MQEKLELITGIPVGNQKLALYHDDADLQPVKVFDDDQRPLGFYSPADFQVLKVRERLSASPQNADMALLIQVVDTNPSITFTGQLTDLSGVDKFELSDEQYALRQGVS